MYGINIFDDIKMPLDWSMLYYGINNNVFDIDVAKEFIYRKLANAENVLEEELDIFWSANSRLDVLDLLKKILEINGNEKENMETAKEKIRTAIIIHLRETEKNIENLLGQIDMIYANFDYPFDMEKFISYMPNTDGYVSTNRTIEENRNYLLCKLDDFIKEKIAKYHLDKKNY